jgi:curved DNA-binding protein CbpA
MLEEYYRILELKPGASVNDLKKARRIQLRAWHPDRFTNDQEMRQKAEEKTKSINAAYDPLMEHLASQNEYSDGKQSSSSGNADPEQTESRGRDHGSAHESDKAPNSNSVTVRRGHSSSTPSYKATRTAETPWVKFGAIIGVLVLGCAYFYFLILNS